MDFRIADTFTDSLARLTGDEQKAVKTGAFDLQLNPANPGMSFHRLATSKDERFCGRWPSPKVSVPGLKCTRRTRLNYTIAYPPKMRQAYPPKLRHPYPPRMRHRA